MVAGADDDKTVKQAGQGLKTKKTIRLPGEKSEAKCQIKGKGKFVEMTLDLKQGQLQFWSVPVKCVNLLELATLVRMRLGAELSQLNSSTNRPDKCPLA